MKKSTSAPFLFFILIASCQSSFQSQSIQYKDYLVTSSDKIDSSYISFLKPYKDSVNNVMNTILAEAETTLPKKQPEGELGNFMTDALLKMSQEKFSEPVDAAFLNYNGIRLPALEKGSITVGKIFELMPFDNVINMQKLKGNILQQFLDHIAALGGWPVSGLVMKISNKKATHVLIQGKPLDQDKYYNIVNSDYITNGGDNCVMLKTIPVITTGYLVRDALITYVTRQGREGKKINAVIENRVVYAD
ncbi:MAG: 5'-nucleotidase C-terminal domain-containing protein [Agriterribacter sp.]